MQYKQTNQSKLKKAFREVDKIMHILSTHLEKNQVSEETQKEFQQVLKRAARIKLDLQTELMKNFIV